MEETAARINVMVERAKQNIKMSELIPLDCLVNIKLSFALPVNHIDKTNFVSKIVYGKRSFS